MCLHPETRPEPDPDFMRDAARVEDRSTFKTVDRREEWAADRSKSPSFGPNRTSTQTENVEETGFGLSGGAQRGATWVEIRELIARCNDLPEVVRGRLGAVGG